MFTRLKSNTSEDSPPAATYQHQLRNTDSINRTHRQDNISNSKGDGLDWFHSITPSPLLDGMTSPIVTSTQQNINSEPNTSWSESTGSKRPNCQTENGILSNTDSTLNSDPKRFETTSILSASDEDNQKHEINQNIEEKGFKTKEECQKDDKHPVSSGYVFEKVAKNLRDRRLRELELKHQHREKEGDGGGGSGVSGDGASKNLIDVLEMTSASPGKNSPSNIPAQDNMSSSKESGFAKDDDGAQTKDLRAKLSGFIFKPKRMRPSVHNHTLNASSEISTGFQTECNQHSRDLSTNKESRGSRLEPVSHVESASHHTDTEKNKRQNQDQILSKSGRRGQQASCVSGMVNSRSEASVFMISEELDEDVFSSGKDKSARRKPIGDQASSKSGPTKSTVAFSTLAQLSRFSFTGSTDPTTTQTKVGKNLPLGEEKSSLKVDDAFCKKTQNFLKHSALGKKIRTVVMNTELPHGQKQTGAESPTKTMSKCQEKQTEPTPSTCFNSATVVDDRPVDHQSAVNLKKRKCFELGPPSCVSGSKRAFSGLPLFGSDELSNDVLDTDWDQEVSKTNRI